MNAPPRPLDAFDFTTTPTRALSDADREAMRDLFDACYRQANHAHMEKSLARLRFVTFARRDGRPVAFGLADAIVVDLPRLPATHVTLGGLCCVLPEARREGLFGELMKRSMMAGDPPSPGERWLAAGRVAHPAAFRTIGRGASAVPKPGLTPAPWQQEVGRAIAEVYGVERFDPETFVCIGSGTTIGHPVIEQEVEPEELELFRRVDRSRGDQLLAITWSGSVPDGWLEK